MQGTTQASSSKQRVASNLLVLGSGQVVTWLVSTFYLAVISHYLGPTLQGEFSRASYIVLLFGLVITLGMDTYITRTVARSPKRADALVTTAIVLRVALAVPVLAALAVYLELAHLTSDVRVIAFTLFVSMIITSINGCLLAAFQGRERMGFGATGAVAQNLLELALVGAVVLLRGGVVAFAITNVVIAIFLLALNLSWMRSFMRLTPYVSVADIREVVKGGLAFWVGTFIIVFYTYIDSVILGALSGDKAVGLYASAQRLLGAPFFVPGIIGTVTLPLLSRLGVGVHDDYVRVARKTLTLLIMCAVPLAIGTATFGGPLMLIVFGQSYAGAIPTLQALAVIILPTFLTTQFYQILVARNQQWRWMVIMLICCVVNPLLNLTIIPYATKQWHDPSVGAAWSLVVTEVIMAVYGIILLREIILHRSVGRAVAGSLAGGLAQGATIWLTAAIWAPIGQTLGLVAFGAVALALGALPRDDISYLWAIILGNQRRLWARLAPTRLQATLIEPPDKSA